MKTNRSILTRGFGKKLAVVLFLAITTAGAFATLGDGKVKKRDRSSKSLLTNKTQTNSFSLRSGYTFRGSQVINTEAKRYANFNTSFTFQKGNTTFVLPLKKKVILSNVKIDISNRQLKAASF